MFGDVADTVVAFGTHLGNESLALFIFTVDRSTLEIVILVTTELGLHVAAAGAHGHLSVLEPLIVCVAKGSQELRLPRKILTRCHLFVQVTE